MVGGVLGIPLEKVKPEPAPSAKSNCASDWAWATEVITSPSNTKFVNVQSVMSPMK